MKLVRLIPILSLAALGACGDDDSAAIDAAPQIDAFADVTPPTVAFSTLTDYAGAVGSIVVDIAATDDVGVNLVDLVAIAGDGTETVLATAAAPFNMLVWDSTALPDGIGTIKLRAGDAAGNFGESPTQHIVVANALGEVSYLDGNTGDIVIPAGWTSTSGIEIDVKHHWNSPAGLQKFIAVLTFQKAAEQTDWTLYLSMGTNICPHDGETFTADNMNPQTTSPYVITVTEPTGYETGLRFVHVAPLMAEEHVGQTLPYQIHVYAFNP
jgi:hypothetical protein